MSGLPARGHTGSYLGLAMITGFTLAMLVGSCRRCTGARAMNGQPGYHGPVDRSALVHVRNRTIDDIADFLRARSKRVGARALDVELTIAEMQDLKRDG